MKNIWTKILSIFAFILCFAVNTFAADFNITSVIYDNSAAMLTINTHDIETANFTELPKLHVVPEENKAYFDINSAILRCPPQDLILSSDDIKEVAVKQFTADPSVVRVLVRYGESYNPKNIQLRKLNNTLYLRFKHPAMSNYYFQQIYSDAIGSVNKFYDSITQQIPVLSDSNSVVNQINSAFNIGSTQQEYELMKKDIEMPTKYHIDNIDVRNGVIYLNGFGVVTITKPFTLSDPDRIVFDIPNAVVSPILHNREISISQYETIKVAQFERETARVVITSNSAQKYMPVIYGDAQKVAFINKSVSSQIPEFTDRGALVSYVAEPFTSETQTVKFVFSKPLIYGIDRNQSSFNLYFMNAEKHPDLNLKGARVFEGAKLSTIRNGGLLLSVPVKEGDEFDVHVGADAKTLRIKLKTSGVQQTDNKVIKHQDRDNDRPRPKFFSRSKAKKLVMIDPGHGGTDYGAIRDNINEKDITLDVSKRVAELLKKKGYDVFMTREIDETVSLQGRVEMSENLQPAIFVSIHVNSSNNEAPNGIETHYYKDNSLELAKTIHASMLNNVSAHNRGLFKSKFYVINHTTAPAVLLEIGFISNTLERIQLITEGRKQATAKSIAEGIDDYFKAQE